MKKDLQKLSTMLGCLMVIATFGMNSAVAADLSKDGGLASTTQGQMDLAQAQGRATLTVEDMKTLLGVDSRDPSSQGTRKQEASASAHSIKVRLNKGEKARMAADLQKIEMERVRLESELQAELQGKVAKVRAERRQIQASRMNAAPGNEQNFSRQLFDSLLVEANLEARAQKSLADFDRKNAVSVEYVQAGSARQVEKIWIGSAVVWASAKTDSVLAAR
jgi:hypothetical protein